MEKIKYAPQSPMVAKCYCGKVEITVKEPETLRQAAIPAVLMSLQHTIDLVCGCSRIVFMKTKKKQS